MGTLLARHAEVLVTMDDDRREIPDGAIFAVDGMISQVGPTSDLPTEAVTLLAFDTPAHLQNWLDSPGRAALLGQAETVMAASDTEIVQSGFEGWFDLAGPAGAKAPAAWKLNYLILAGLYPIVMLEVLFSTTSWTG